MMDTNKDLVLATAGERNAVRKAFWKAYCDANGYQATETGKINPATGLIAGDQFGLEIDNRAKYEIPCVLYVDRDGYYAEYTRFAKNQSSGESEYKNIYTKKQSFSKDYGTATTYHVTYTLGTDVEVEMSDQNGPRKISGTYEALKALEKKKGARYAADYIKRTLGDITFTSYPLDTAVFEEFANGLAKELE